MILNRCFITLSSIEFPDKRTAINVRTDKTAWNADDCQNRENYLFQFFLEAFCDCNFKNFINMSHNPAIVEQVSLSRIIYLISQ